MEDFKEVTKQIHEYQWQQDDQVAACNICIKDFSVARRKHHCRRCGRIFCNECSDNKMTLPSSSKVSLDLGVKTHDCKLYLFF
jgi:hypothetical protein